MYKSLISIANLAEETRELSCVVFILYRRLSAHIHKKILYYLVRYIFTYYKDPTTI